MFTSRLVRLGLATLLAVVTAVGVSDATFGASDSSNVTVVADPERCC